MVADKKSVRNFCVSQLCTVVHKWQRAPQQIQQRGRESLKQLDAAVNLNDLMIPPSNMLEELRGNRKGQHSIRINQQYRVCFVWEDGNASEVEIVDYH